MLKKILNALGAVVDWILSIRHVSCETRIELYSAFRKAVREFYHDGKCVVQPDCDESRILGKTFCSPDKPRILVDVSQMVLFNARSGIQRVVVKVLDAMLKDQRCQYVPVAYFHGHMYYAEYHQDDCSFHLVGRLQLMKADTLLMLDSSWDHYSEFRKVFKQLRKLEGKICVVVYDLIPVLFPQYAAAGMPQMFESWLRAAIPEADVMLCISATVAGQLRDYIVQNRMPVRNTGLKIGHFCLGADFAQADSRPVDPEVVEILNRVRGKKKFLSVSTLEPRKNYDFMLRVVEKLWERGLDIVYLIVGRKGWNTEEVIRKISGHPELNKRLFWFSYCNDSTLQLLYRSSDVLLNLSLGEGYGLSLVEGAHYQCAVIASDIPVFREVITDQTTLFCDTGSLEKTVNEIVRKYETDQLLPSDAKHFLWQDSLDQILDALFHEHWDYALDRERQ